MAGKPIISADGLAGFQKDLRAIGPEWAKELRLGNKAVAEKAAAWGRRRLASGTPLQRHVAGLNAVRAQAQQRFAIVQINATAKKNRMALGAELGSVRYRQFPKYREDVWRGGIPSGGYGVIPSIHDHIGDIRDEYGQMIDRLTRRAFPFGASPKVNL